MNAYLSLLRDVLERGNERPDRTGVGTRSLFGAQARFDLKERFPLLTTKKMFWKGIVVELLWFLRGDTNVRFLQERGVHIWDEWADEDGELGPVYGAQWRRWRSESGEEIDQITNVLTSLKEDPYSRRHLVSAWNVGALPDMRLAPCHVLLQFYVHDGTLSCHLYQRSADVFLGVPFNIACYALLTKMIAHVIDLKPGEFIHSFGDLHLYKNHIEQAKLQLTRKPSLLPHVVLCEKQRDLFAFRYHDIKLREYTPQSKIPAPVAI